MPYDPTPMGDQYFSSIQWDEQGNPFQITQSGHRSYIPPAAASTSDSANPVGKRLVEWAAGKGATYANPGGASPQGGFAHNRGTFDQDTGGWDRGSFFNTPLGALVLGGGTMAAGPIAGAFMGAGGTGGATSAALGAGEAGIPTTSGIASATSLGLPTTAGLGSAGAAGAAGLAEIPATYGLESGAGIGTDVGMPAASDLSGLVPGGGLPGGGLPGGASSLLTDPKWSPLFKALAGVGGLMGGHFLGNAATQNTVPPELSELLKLSLQRANAQTPLFNATNQGIYDMLPNFAKKG